MEVVSSDKYCAELDVVSKINNDLGNDLTKLNDYQENINKLEEEKQKIENSLLVNSSMPSKISVTIKRIEDTFEKIEKLSEQHNNLKKSVTAYEGKVSKVKSIAADYIEKISTLDKIYDYLDLVREIEEVSNTLETAINEKNEKKQVFSYLKLHEIYTSLNDTKCTHLWSYVNETLHYWHNILRDKFTTDYEEILKGLKWPFIGNSIMNAPTTEIINQFQVYTEYLLKIQFCKREKPESVSSTLPQEFEPLSLPMVLLIKPLKKRFTYHFMGKRQTNRADKPEWYFTQILTWIRDHQDFIGKNLQPIYYSKFKEKKISAKIEFMRGLVQIAVEKLHYELPHLFFDDSLFSHCVDESLGFDKELKNSFDYPPSEPGVIVVLTQARIFVKWINMEKRFALDKMDILLSSPTAFQPLISGDVDENQVTEFGNSFLTLLSTITERYEMLPQPGHRLQFLQLQLDLIDDFRVRLLQKLREENSEPLSSNFPFVLNTVNYVKEVLNEWGVNTLFLHLQYYKAKLEGKTDPTGTVFDECLIVLEKMRDDLLNYLVDNVFLEVKAKSMFYRKDKWHAMESLKNFVKPTITSTACPMFEVLITKLHQLQEVLAKALFKQSWQMLANKIDVYLFEEIVIICNFNEGGALQFNYDITKNLFPLFGQYSNKPEVNFKLLKDSCLLLTMSKGLAMSLIQAITEKQENKYDEKEILAEIGVYSLQKDEVLEVLSRRTDLDGLTYLN